MAVWFQIRGSFTIGNCHFGKTWDSAAVKLDKMKMKIKCYAIECTTIWQEGERYMIKV